MAQPLQSSESVVRSLVDLSMIKFLPDNVLGMDLSVVFYSIASIAFERCLRTSLR